MLFNEILQGPHLWCHCTDIHVVQTAGVFFFCRPIMKTATGIVMDMQTEIESWTGINHFVHLCVVGQGVGTYHSLAFLCCCRALVQ